ncbi:hypothetical protein SKAU_G00074440 [Synaphobranchus kaupii]|uniref:AB hydrolase-1 domain-containing protein n=1 Tax=Synaphobranchus kaupii TaxID=118154 RepID=A0A9Q1G7E1_SYNKA|nr:hypothetical protein SKAU_G00074440 [Synaphobranchus kaupii]
MKAAKQNVNGVDLFYQQTGTGKHAVMLIPAAMGSGQTHFGPQLESLNKDLFTVVNAVDLMLALNFKQFSLLGWCGGGSIALIAAAQNPSLVRKLVVWGSRAYLSEQDVKTFDAYREFWNPWMRKAMEDMYGAQGFSEVQTAWLDAITQFAQRPDADIYCELLPLISCPTLIVHGEKDPLVPACHPQYLLKHIRGSRLHLMPEGKHNLHLVFPAEFNELVEEFLCE